MEKVRSVFFSCDEVFPETDRILARSGCPPSKRQSLGKSAERGAAELMSTAEPLALYRNLEVLKTEEDIIKTDVITFESCSLVKYLRNPSVITLFLVSAGPGPESRAEELSAEGQHLRSYMLDSAASEMVEKAARVLHRKVADSMTDFRSSARFAPGFGDLALDCQGEIVDLLKGGEYGISLMEDSCMLVPAKSTTGVIGWHRLNN